MGLFDFLSQRPGRAPSVITPLTAAEVRKGETKFPYVMTWRCPCGTQMRIRSTEPRKDSSNWVGDQADCYGQKHSILQPHLLTWDALANERGWETNPTRCPACIAGMPLAAFKQMRREQRFAFEAQKATDDAARAARRQG